MRKLLKQAVSIFAIIAMLESALPINAPVSKAKNIETEESYIIMTEQQKVSDQIADNYEGEQLDDNSKMISVDLTKSEARLLDSRDGVIIEKDLILEGSNIESEGTESTDGILPVMEGQMNHPWNMEAIGVTANDQNPRKVKVELLDSGVSAALDIEIAENIDLVHKADEEI